MGMGFRGVLWFVSMCGIYAGTALEVIVIKPISRTSKSMGEYTQARPCPHIGVLSYVPQLSICIRMHPKPRRVSKRPYFTISHIRPMLV